MTPPGVAIAAALPCEPPTSEQLTAGAEPLVMCSVAVCGPERSLMHTPAALATAHDCCMSWVRKSCPMQLFGHPLQLVRLNVDGIILDLMAGLEGHLQAATLPLQRRPSSLPNMCKNLKI